MHADPSMPAAPSTNGNPAMHANPLRLTVAGLLALALAMGIGRFAFTPLLPLMQQDGLVSVSGGGVIAAVHFAGYLIGALAAARLSHAPKRWLQTSLLAVALGTLGMGFSDSFWVWLFWRFVCGVCSAFTLVLVSNYIVRALTASGQATKQGWVFAGVGVGIAAAGLGALWIMVAGISSQQGWIAIGIATLVATLAVNLMTGPEFAADPPQSDGQSRRRSLLQWRLILAYGATGLGYIIPATYLPVMAREIIASPLVFGWSWPVFGLAAALSTILAARLAERFSYRQIWIGSQFVLAASLLLPAAAPNIIAINIAGIGVGGTFMIITMAGMKEAHRLAPPEDAMRHIAAMTGAFATGQILGPLAGSLSFEAAGSFAPALVATSVVLVGTALAMTGKAADARSAVHL